ncbi:MFS transporter [Streptomyces apocyni]|uniref:MFS transporter n=1 Tax=Streptomyces apocyni TaxID=2654677 RepID=UPI0012E9DC1C|nr:MFS transporter [Streptomyces apocyni]
MPSRSSSRGHPVWTLVVTGLAVFMAALDNLVVITALPAIQESLNTSLQDLEWTVNSYTLFFAVFLMAGAAAGDRFGRRRMFVVGLVVFTGASAACALSDSSQQLIVARAVQGLGAAMVMPLTLTLLTVAVPPRRRGIALGIWGALSGLAVALGPLIGGAVVEKISWEWIFWVNVPIGVVVLLLSLWKLAESKHPDSALDPVGTLLGCVGMFGVVFALVRTTEHGWTSGAVLSPLVGGVVGLVAFVGWEIRTRRPMLPMRLFRNRAFSAVNAASLLMFAAMFGLVFLLTQFMQLIQGFSPLEAGVRMLPWTAMPVVVAPLAALLTPRFGNRVVVAAGLLFEAVGLGWLAAVASVDTQYVDQIPGLVLGGVGLGLFFAPVAEMAMAVVAPADQGIVSGANNTFRELGGVLGVAVLTSVFTAQGGYASPQQFVDGLVPASWLGAALAALGCLAILAAPRRSKEPRAVTVEHAIPDTESVAQDSTLQRSHR